MTEILVHSSLAFLAGVLLNFTPCVLPVIPFKIQAVLSEIKGDLRSRMLAAGFLVAGSLGFFIILGGATAYLGLTWGALFQSKIFLAILSAFLLVSALATFLDYSFRLPQMIYKVPIHRYLGAFLTGVLAGVLSTPCSGPFLGSVLAYAVTQPPSVIMTVFVFIGIGLGFPYVLILVWPGLLGKLTYTRPWAIQVKHLLGFVLLAGSIFFSQALIPQGYHIYFWWALLVTLIGWSFFMLKKSKGWFERIFPLTTLAIILILFSYKVLPSSDKQFVWMEFTTESMQTSLQKGQPVLLEFTADWCFNCKILEKLIYTDQQVIQAAQSVNLISYRVDMTEFDETEKALLAQYGGTALPFAVLFNNSGVVAQRFVGMFTAKVFKEAILKLNGRRVLD